MIIMPMPAARLVIAIEASVTVQTPEAPFSLLAGSSSFMTATVYTADKDDIESVKMNVYLGGEIYSFNWLAFSFNPGTGMWQYSGSVAHASNGAGSVIAEAVVGGKSFYSDEIGGVWYVA
jgi:hypothetical protein